MGVYKLSANSVKNGRTIYGSMLAGNTAFVPVPDGAVDPLQVITVGPAGASSVSFTNIPSTYTHLQIRYIGRLSGSANNQGVYMKFNSSNANYQYLGGHALYGNGSSASAIAGWQGSSTAGGVLSQSPAANAGSNVFGAAVADILDYANTNKTKTVRSLDGYDNNGSGEIHLFSFFWNDTSAISSINVIPDSSFVANTQIALYGIKGA